MGNKFVFFLVFQMNNSVTLHFRNLWKIKPNHSCVVEENYGFMRGKQYLNLI